MDVVRKLSDSERNDLREFLEKNGFVHTKDEEYEIRPCKLCSTPILYHGTGEIICLFCEDSKYEKKRK